MIEVKSVQFYHSVRIEKKERQTFAPGVDGVHAETTIQYIPETQIFEVKSPLEDCIVYIGLTNVRSFRVIKQNEFVFSREKSIPSLDKIESNQISIKDAVNDSNEKAAVIHEESAQKEPEQSAKPNTKAKKGK